MLRNPKGLHMAVRLLENLLKAIALRQQPPGIQEMAKPEIGRCTSKQWIRSNYYK
jgi:hypothetical protein